jgi:hypothetical protein
MASGRAWRTLYQKAVTVWPESTRPEASVTVPLMSRGRRSPLLEELVDGEQRGLGVEGVEDGLDQQHVGAALDQALDLLVVGRAQLLEVDVARAGVVDVGADAGGLGRGAERAGDEARLVGRAELVAGGARQAGRGDVHLARQALPCRSRPGRRRWRRRCWSR